MKQFVRRHREALALWAALVAVSLGGGYALWLMLVPRDPWLSWMERLGLLALSWGAPIVVWIAATEARWRLQRRYGRQLRQLRQRTPED
jgi:hypothetical protein